MRRAVVTGASGFLGSALVRELAGSNYEVWASTRTQAADSSIDSPGVHLAPASLTALRDALPSQDYDAFYHLAWAGTAGPARFDTRLQLRNAQRAIDALRLAAQVGCRRFLCAGTIMEHETIAAAHAQGNRPSLGYIYGSAKQVAHAMCMSVAADIGIDLVWPELTNAYGVGERSLRLINTTIRKCIRGEAPKFTSGTQNYDFVYVDDAVRALRLIGENGRPFHEYLIGSGTARPLREFLLEMQQAIVPELDFVFGSVPYAGIDLPLSVFDCSVTERDTGFRAEVSFAEGCRRTFQWWQQISREEAW